MESRLKLLGHPIHPMLVVLPLGLFASSVLFDIVYVATGDETLAEVVFYNIALGIVGGLAAALFGVIDWLAIPWETRAKRIGLIHGIGNVVIVGLFLVSWLLRIPNHAYLPDLLPFVLGLVAVVLVLGTAWLGGDWSSGCGLVWIATRALTRRAHCPATRGWAVASPAKRRTPPAEAGRPDAPPSAALWSRPSAQPSG